MLIPKRLAVKLTDYGNPKSFASRLRARRSAPLIDLIRKVYREKGAVRIIDMGGTERYWTAVPQDVLTECGVSITVANLPGVEKEPDHGGFRFVSADCCDLSMFSDDAFDIAHSNSVIEHVGDWNRMCEFAEETVRLAPHFYVQTPNYWFPVEPHCMTPFFHWIPKPLRVRLVMRFQLGHYPRAETVSQAVSIVEDARLLDRRMMQALFAGAEIRTERFMLFTKSLSAVKQ